MADLVPTSPAPLPAALDRFRGLTGQAALRRAVPWFIGAGALGAAALAWAVISAPPQRQLYAQLGDDERASVVAALDGAGISYVIDSATGALSVAEDQLYRARMVVAADGALAVPDTAASLDSLPMGASRTLEGARPFEPTTEVVPAFYEAPWFGLALRSGLGLVALLLVLLLVVRPLLRQLKGGPADAASAPTDEALAGLPESAAGSSGQQDENAAQHDQALLGKQVELAQRLVEEKPEEAIVALRRMLKPAEAQS